MSPSNAVDGRADGGAIVAVYVLPPGFRPVVIARANGSAQCRRRFTPGLNYVLQGATNLVNWTSISTNFARSLYLEMFDPESSLYTTRFYRAISEQ